MNKRIKRPFDDDQKHLISKAIMRTFVEVGFGFKHAEPAVFD